MFKFDHRLWVIPLILIICASLLGYTVYYRYYQTNSAKPSALSQLGSLVTKQSNPVRGEGKDRINVLLLGIGGDGHDGGTLTDSIMIASIKPSTKQVALLSLPRDLVVKIYSETNPDYWEGHKINSVYALRDMKTAVQTIEGVTGLTMHYYVLLDFSGFQKLIDDVGGVDVPIDNTFTGLYGASELSYQCPKTNLYYLDDGPYCAIKFVRGSETMMGERALIYARLRKLISGPAAEAEDFGRAKRQQYVLQAFKAKLLSAGTILNPGRMAGMLTDIDSHVQTNLQLWEMYRLYQLTGSINPANTINRVVDNSPDGLVKTTITSSGADVVVPVAGDYDYSGIQKLAKDIFNEPVETLHATSLPSDTSLQPSDITIQVLNGTNERGLANTAAANLTVAGFTVGNVGNAITNDYTTTTIYQISDQIDQTILEKITTVVSGEIASARQTDTLLSLDSNGTLDTSADLIIIVGHNDEPAAQPLP
ncbi:MAG: LCP family protein [Patescibacteria group bacterium]